MKKMNKKGFTLIEMLAVIAIIAVLVAIIVPAVGSSTTKAKAAADAANLRSALSAATIEYAENGLTDGKLSLSLTTPACKTFEGADLEIYQVGDELKACYVSSNKYYDINYFSTIADGKSAPTAGTAAPGTEIWPGA